MRISLLVIILLITGCVNNSEEEYKFDEETVERTLSSEEYSISDVLIFDKEETLNDTLLINPSKLAKIEVTNDTISAHALIASYNLVNEDEAAQLDSLNGAIPIGRVSFWEKIETSNDIRSLRYSKDNLMLFIGLPDSLNDLKRAVSDAFLNN